MSTFNDHCRDCEKILGDRMEHVNRWRDELFRKYGPQHRRHRHCWKGVREAKHLFGAIGAKAAVIHIVRDCGAVPNQRVYDETNLGIMIVPETFMYDSATEKAWDKFYAAVLKELVKMDSLLGSE